MSEENAAPQELDWAEGVQLAQTGTGLPLESEVGQPESEAHEPALLAFDPGVAIWTIVVFLLLLVILRRMVWGPILSSIEQRDRTIKESLEKAQEVQAESKRLAEEQNRILASAHAQAKDILQSTRQASEEMRSNLEKAAKEEKDRIVQSAQKDIESAKNAAMADLRKTTAALSIGVAEKLIRQSLNDEAHRRLVDGLIDEMTAEGWK